MVYFIQEGENGPIKIGRSGNPEKRLGNLQEGNPRKLKIIAVLHGDRQRENEIHHELRRFGIRGEWFYPTREVFDYINRDQHIDYEVIDGNPIAVLWCDKENSMTDYCPFCQERHIHNGKDGRYKVACGPFWSRRLIIILDDGISIKQADGYIIRSRTRQLKLEGLQ